MDTVAIPAELLPLATLRARLIAQSRGAPSVRSLTRWAALGVVVDRRTIRLDATRRGGRWLCSEQSYIDFCERVTRAARRVVERDDEERVS